MKTRNKGNASRPKATNSPDADPRSGSPISKPPFFAMRKPIIFLLALCSLLLAPGATTAEPIDLGQGLAYLRIHAVAQSAADLRQAAAGSGALVLDLRYATADDTAAGILQTALAARPTGALLMVLVSPATPKALTAVIITSSALTLGAPGSVPVAKVTVQTDAATDRRAFDALETGTELSKLITGRIEKERFDEASLVQEFKNGNRDAEPPPPPDPTAAKDDDAPAKDAPPPMLIDRVLQRAVHLHRALLVLKR